jgi:hypothetical protein
MGRRSLIERITPRVWMGALGAQSLDNAVSMIHVQGGGASNSVHTQSGTATAPVCIAAVALRAKYSGIFRVSCAVAWSSSATGNSVTHELVAIPFASTPPGWNILVNAASPVSASLFVGKDVPETTSWNSLANAGVLTSDAAGTPTSGIEINAGGVASPINHAATGAVTIFSSTDPTLTGLLSGGAQKFNYDGLVPLPSQVGRVVCVGIAVMQSTASTITYADLALSMQEVPFS